MEPLRLQTSSQRWLSTGLAAFAQGDGSFDFAVHHFGVALEHLLKAYLASQHPALVVEASDFESLLHATGHGDRAKRPSTRTKTIGLAVAFSRVKRLLAKKITVTEAEFEPVLAARNGVAHAAHYDSDEVMAVLTTCLRIADTVLVELGIPPEEYWGDHLQLHDHLADRRATELQMTFTTKIAQAKAVAAGRLSSMTSEQRRRMVAELSAFNSQPSAPYPGEPGTIDYDRHQPCPACNGQGWLHGATDIDWHGVVADSSSLPVVLFHASSYDCGLCGLHLTGDELSLAGLNLEIQLPHLSPFAPLVSNEEWERQRHN
jgi:hypothetical protein